MGKPRNRKLKDTMASPCLFAFCAILALGLRVHVNSTFVALAQSMTSFAAPLFYNAAVIGFYLLVVIVTFMRPALLAASYFATAAVLCLVGTLGALASCLAGLPGVLGVCLLTMAFGADWLTVLVLEGLTALGHRKFVLGLPLSIAINNTLDSLFANATATTLTAVSIACIIAMYAFSKPLAGPVLEQIAHSERLSDASVLRPMSYLPLTSIVFASIFVFSLAVGFAISVGNAAATEYALPIRVVTLISVGFWCFLGNSNRRFDTVLQISAVSLWGFALLLPIFGPSSFATDAALIGSECFSLFFYYVTVSVATQNRLASVFIFAWSNAARALGHSAGSFLASTSHHLLAGPTDTTLAMSALVFFGFGAFVIVALHRHSFAQIIDGIAPDVPLKVPTASTVDTVHRRCNSVAQRCRLTPREREVLEYLAHGRNGTYIHERLGLTPNTVKTYIRHIYAKLGVHSHQELIDLVEREPASLPQANQ